MTIEQDHGTVQYKGLTLTITQVAYIDREFATGIERDVYRAHAVDADGADYKVTWEITNPDADDTSDACDWTVYTVRKL
jgi:hypothetical protein